MAVPIADPRHVSRERVGDRLQAEHLVPIPPPRCSGKACVEEADNLLVRLPRSTHHVLRLFVVNLQPRGIAYVIQPGKREKGICSNLR